MANIKFTNIHKSFGTNKIISNFNLVGREDEFLVLVGPSGCGKSTLLRMIAGLERIDEGEIYINDQLVNELHPSKRQTAMVFQSYALYPHMNVYENMSFGLKMEKRPKKEIEQKVMHAAKILQIEELLERKPKQLSGGQRQRVALARVLVTEPQILLLDEPLSALDKKLREEMKIWIKELQKKLKITTVYVTHDQSEALTMSDRIAVMDKGKISQIGTSTDIYERPKNKFVADFIGISNFLPLKIISSQNSHLKVSFNNKEFIIPDMNYNSDTLTAVLRPEHIIINPEINNNLLTFEGVVEIISYQGSLIRYIINSNNIKFISEFANLPKSKQFKSDEKIQFGFDLNNLVVF